MTLVAEIKRYAAKIGLDKIRVTHAEPFPEYIKIVQNRIKSELIPAESLETNWRKKKSQPYSVFEFLL